MVNEEDAFASVLTLKKNYMVMVICEILILLLYCGFYIAIVRRISKKSDELNEDLNGLKEINDKIGHIAGDTLIITASYALQEIFLDNSYRVGGDEFVVIGQDVSELLFFDQYAKLLKRMKELEISVATGCVWKETCSNLSETLQEAIKRCMKIKSDIILYLKMIEEDKKDWKLNSNLLCVFEMKLCYLVKLFFSKFLYEFLAAHIHLASGTFLKFKIIFFFHKIPRF